ncbi:hypothetical protein [Microcoleus vaginatus]
MQIILEFPIASANNCNNWAIASQKPSIAHSSNSPPQRRSPNRRTIRSP